MGEVAVSNSEVRDLQTEVEPLLHHLQKT